VFELDAVRLRPSDHRLLADDRKRFPRDRIVHPLLQQQDRAPGSGTSAGNEDEFRRIDQRRILGPVDEAREVEVVLIGPARCLFDERSEPCDSGDRGA
jgi:hypothetical protein